MDKYLARNSSFELLRIISIIMIIVLHYLGYSILDNVNKFTLNYYLTYFIESICIMGVNTFVLISGYFLIMKDKVNIRKVVDLLIILAFYGFIFYFWMMLVNKTPFNIKDLIKSMIPFWTGKRWFVRTYIILFLISPFLNKGLRELSKKSFEKILFILILFFSIWPSFFPYPPVTDDGYGIINFVLLYTIGAYIRLHYKNDVKVWKYIFIYILCILGTYLGRLYYGYTWTYNFITNIMGSVILFLIFSKLKIQSKIINYIALFVFGIYMVHYDIQIQDFIYGKLLRCSIYSNSNGLIIHIIFSITILFLVSLLVDIIRSRIFNIIINPIVDRIKLLNKEIE
ncbi:MAG: acyltransferase family protein [Intestinibacter bartlettii]|uniref:acyltransferase family protein n=1 Tax=Intestinibacter bartlettii TaxID=261299 RepID=UPI0039A2A30F